MSGLTVLIAMRDVADPKPGMRVLINGASGGVGLFAGLIARSMGTRVAGECHRQDLEDLACRSRPAR